MALLQTIPCNIFCHNNTFSDIPINRSRQPYLSDNHLPGRQFALLQNQLRWKNVSMECLLQKSQDPKHKQEPLHHHNIIHPRTKRGPTECSHFHPSDPRIQDWRLFYIGTVKLNLLYFSRYRLPGRKTRSLTIHFIYKYNRIIIRKVTLTLTIPTMHVR